MLRGEAELTQQVADYLRLQYPRAPFHVDFGAGTKLTIGQARRQARLNQRGFPDLAIFVPRFGFYGLLVELKQAGTRITKRDGSFASDHIREQAQVLAQLNALGYKAVFGIGFDETKTILDSYLTTAPDAQNWPKPPDAQVS